MDSTSGKHLKIENMDKPYILTWENDYKVDDLVASYCKDTYPDFELKCLDSLDKRDSSYIYNSLKSPFVRHLIIRPNLLDKDQTLGIINLITKGLFGRLIGENLQTIQFLTIDPKETASQIVNWCREEDTIPRPNVVTYGEYVGALNELHGICHRVNVMFVPELKISKALTLRSEGWNTNMFSIEIEL